MTYEHAGRLSEAPQEEWEAIVIGAGPAGSVTARELARHGCRVLLVDKSSFPRSKVCGCCLNGAAIDTLKSLGLSHVLNDAVPLNRVNIGAGNRVASLPLRDSVSLSRQNFDSRLIEDAIKQGVVFRPGTMAKLGPAQQDGYVVFLNSVATLARVVILATGLAGGEGVPDARSRIGAGTTIPATIASGFYKPGTIYMAIGRYGYVGLVRVEDGNLDIAAAFDAGLIKASGGLGPAAEAILRGLNWPVAPGLTELPWKGTPALTRRPVNVASRKLFLVGDAAGYIEPFTGEGMAWAIMSATALAPIAAKAVQDWDEGSARDWQLAHRRVLGSRQRFCWMVAQVLRSSTLSRFAISTLAAFPRFARPVMAAINTPHRQAKTA